VRQILKYPLITEKSSALQGSSNQYVFVVDSSANKIEIKNAVEALKKGVEVTSVQTLINRGKVKRIGRSVGKRSNVKKAIVRLKAGQTLELFEAA
jgi:large subunit ribosomal protein L23